MGGHSEEKGKFCKLWGPGRRSLGSHMKNGHLSMGVGDLKKQRGGDILLPLASPSNREQESNHTQGSFDRGKYCDCP